MNVLLVVNSVATISGNSKLLTLRWRDFFLYKEIIYCMLLFLCVYVVKTLVSICGHASV